MGSKDKPIESRVDTIDNKNSSREEDGKNSQDQEQKSSEIYEHIRESESQRDNDLQVVDAATEEQRKETEGEIMKQEDNAKDDDEMGDDISPDDKDEQINDGSLIGLRISKYLYIYCI